MPQGDQKSQLSALFKECGHILRYCGGVKAILRSPALWVSLGLAVYLAIYGHEGWRWTETAIKVLPVLLVVSLIVIIALNVFGSVFRDIVIRKDTEAGYSLYMAASARYTLLIIVEAVALGVAIIFEALDIQHRIPNFIGSWLFIFSLLFTIGAVVDLFSFSKLYDQSPKDGV